MPTPLTAIPTELRTRPFVSRAAADRGLSPSVLQGSRFVAITRGVWSVGPTDLRTRVSAVLSVLPDETAATGRTGLQLYGVGLGPTDPLTFVTTHPHQVRRAGVSVSRRGGAPPAAFVEPPATCFAAAGLSLVDSVAAGDRLVHLGLVTPEELLAAVVPGQRGALLARRAAGFVRARVESYKESELRLVAVLAGLPEPRCNLDIGSATRWLARGDLVWDDYGVLAEYDGLQHLTDRGQWERDVIRLEELARAGWVVIRVTAARLRRPRQLVRDLEAALRAGGWSGSASYGPDWSGCFASAH